MFCVTMCNFDFQESGYYKRAAGVRDGAIGSPLDHGLVPVSCCLGGRDFDLHNALFSEAVTLICSKTMHANMCGLHVLDGYRQDVSPEMGIMRIYW